MPGKKGRPEKDTVPVMVRMEPELLAKIDEYRRVAPDLPSRPEVIRRLVERALADGHDAKD